MKMTPIIINIKNKVHIVSTGTMSNQEISLEATSLLTQLKEHAICNEEDRKYYIFMIKFIEDVLEENRKWNEQREKQLLQESIQRDKVTAERQAREKEERERRKSNNWLKNWWNKMIGKKGGVNKVVDIEDLNVLDYYSKDINVNVAALRTVLGSTYGLNIIGSQMRQSIYKKLDYPGWVICDVKTFGFDLTTKMYPIIIWADPKSGELKKEMLEEYVTDIIKKLNEAIVQIDNIGDTRFTLEFKYATEEKI